MRSLIFVVMVCAAVLQLHAQERTVGLVYYTQEVSDGYTLITSHHSTSSYLINNCGEVVHEWESTYLYGNSVDLLENGLLLRATRENTIEGLSAGGAGGRVELLDWNGNIVWEFFYASEQYRQHHDVLGLPNGNVLILAWDLRTREEAIGAGLNPDFLGNISDDIWSEHVIEVKPVGQHDFEIVWEWYLWDHLVQDFDESKANFGVVADHPELVDLNYNTDPGNPDWIHANALSYNEELDQILINSRNFSEFWVIDHSTTTGEAGGHSGGNSGIGGDILYRYGNPAVYLSEAAVQQLYSQHNTHWIDRNNILLFNNGRGREPQFSEILFLETPVQSDGSYAMDPAGYFGPDEPLKSYSSEDIAGFFYSPFISGAELLENGNLLICSGPSGTVSEVAPDGTTLWTYISPLTSSGIVEQGTEVVNNSNINNLMYRSKKYSPKFPGLSGRELTPRGTIERTSLSSLCATVVAVRDPDSSGMIYPNPFEAFIIIPSDGMVSDTEVRVFTLDGRIIHQVPSYSFGTRLVLDDLAAGTYILMYSVQNHPVYIRLIKI